MTDLPVSRAEFAALMTRVDSLDIGGTRNAAVLSVQMQDLAKDVAKLEKQMDDHRIEHRDAESARVSGRRWLIAAVIAAVAAVDGPVLTLVLAVKH